MPLKLLDGTNANLDFMLGTASYKCQLSSVAVEFSRQTFQRTTFCSSNWTVNIAGMKSARFEATGFPGSGTTASKPAQFFLSDTPPAMMFTVDTGCTIGFTANITREQLGMVAAANGSYSISGENASGDLAVIWVTS